MSKIKYYSLDNIKKHNCDYNIIYGERSNGKTTAVLLEGINDYIKSGYINQIGLIRRWEEDMKGKNGANIFSGIVGMNVLESMTKGKYNNIYSYGQRWYLCKYNEDGEKLYMQQEPFCIGFSITSEEHYKSTTYPNIKNILFDEFITRTYYLPDEFIKFQNLLSTIIRLRDDVKIYMCGNTVNQYCPYFAEMGLTNIRKQQQGTIDIYKYGESGLSVAVEYCNPTDSKSKKSNKYFAFNNPKLQMIKSGSWEIAIYPHIPVKYTPSEIKYIYFIIFNEHLLQCEIIYSKILKSPFTYIHLKTTKIKDNNKNIVFDIEPNAKYNYRRKITKPTDELSSMIYKFFVEDKVFYQNNEVGEIIRNYILWCKKEGI